MRVLFDIVHPADVHFFKHAATQLLEEGHQVVLASRDKDVTLPLLERMQLGHTVLSRQGRGTIGLLSELARREVAMWRLARAFRPDVLIANNSPCAAHIGAALGKPSIVFDDTEINRHNRLLYQRIATEIHSPESFRMVLGKKHQRFPGVHALAYLHPDHFAADSDVPRSYGIDPSQPYFVFRFVSWAAAHDLGVQGLTPLQKEEIVQLTSRYGRVIISSEAKVPATLRKYCQPMSPGDIHHVIGHASGIISESATVCAEAACLGRPSILIDRFGRGYTDALEQTYRLCRRHTPENWAEVLCAVDGLCLGGVAVADLAINHERFLKDSVNVSHYQLSQVSRLAGDLAGSTNKIESWD